MSNKKFRKKPNEGKSVNATKTTSKLNNKNRTKVPDHFLGYFNQLIQNSNMANMQLNTAQMQVEKIRSDIEGYFYKICAKMGLDPDLVMIEQEKETGTFYIVDKKDVNLDGTEKLNDPSKQSSNDKDPKVKLKNESKDKDKDKDKDNSQDKDNQSNVTNIKSREVNSNDKPKRAYKKKAKVNLEENINPEVNPDIVN